MPRSWWRDANVFFGMFTLAGTIGVSLLFKLVAWLAGLFMDGRNVGTVALPVAYLLLLLALAWIFRALGMSSIWRDPLNRRQIAIAHGMLLVAHAITALAFVPSVMGPIVAGLARAMMVFAALLMLHAARRLPPALTAAKGYADTRPQDA
jgi:hypothetical protein